MAAKSKSRSAGPTAPVGILKPLLLRVASAPADSVKAARRPLVPTHTAGTTNHSRHHVARSAQS